MEQDIVWPYSLIKSSDLDMMYSESWDLGISKGCRDQLQKILDRNEKAQKIRLNEPRIISDDCMQLSDEEIETRNRLFSGV